MATLADGFQITMDDVEREIKYAEAEQKSYKADNNDATTAQEGLPNMSQTIHTPAQTSPLPDASCKFEFLRELLGEKYAELRLDELAQLAFVASVCAEAKNQADASRRLRINQNDSKDGSPQLFKYLYHLGLNFDTVKTFARGLKPSDSSQVRR
jgi:sigma54-dependent transcription regulator